MGTACIDGGRRLENANILNLPPIYSDHALMIDVSMHIDRYTIIPPPYHHVTTSLVFR